MCSFKFGSLWAALLLLGICFTACEGGLTGTEDETVTSAELTSSVELRSDSTLLGMHRGGGLGRLGCFDLVYPVGITFPDGTTVEASDYDALRAAVAAWIEANPDTGGRPDFIYPLELINEAGELISVPSQDSLRTLARTCRGAFGDRGGRHGRRGGGDCSSCYTITFPITVAFPDGTTVEASNRQALRDLTRDWKQANPDATERPTFVFPITVTLEDGTTQTVNSAEELSALRESCRDDDDN